MFKIRNLVTLGILLVLGILVYNRFLGTPEEQQQAKTTFQTIGKAAKEVGSAVGGLLKSEKEKFDEGKYDKAMDQISGLFQNLKSKVDDVSENSQELMDNINQFNEQKQAIEDKIAEFKGTELSDEESINANEEIKGELGKLKGIIDVLEKELESKERK